MFTSFFQLREQPFGINPDTRYLYMSKTHREVFSSLLYRIQTDCGFLAMIAQPGMGKTTLLFHLLNHLQGIARTAFVFQTKCTSDELMRYLLSEFECDASLTDRVRMMHELKKVLVAEANAGRRAVVLIDEAQNLETDVLETVRLLSDFETPRRKLLQIILSGQPELAEKLADPALSQLRQRFSIIAHLDGFAAEETVLYISHRLKMAGFRGDVSQIFDQHALAQIALFSEGIPRVINNICFNALSLGFATGVRQINSAIVEEAVRDLGITDKVEIAGASFEVAEAIRKATLADVYAAVANACNAERDGRTERKPEGVGEGEGSEAHACKRTSNNLDGSQAFHIDKSAMGAGVAAAPALDGVPRLDKTVSARRSEAKTSIDASQLLGREVREKHKSRKSGSKTPALVPHGRRTLTFAVSAIALCAAGSISPTHSRLKHTETYAETAASQAVPAAPIETSLVKNSDPEADPAVAVEHRGEFKERHARATQNDVVLVAKQGPGKSEESIEGEEPVTATLDTTQYGLPLSVLPLASATMTRVKVAASAAAPRPVTFVSAKAVSNPAPVYPPIAKQLRIEGDVVLLLSISEAGAVQELKVLKGNGLLASAATNAAMRWKYSPALENGSPVETQTQVVLQFRLGRDGLSLQP